MIRNFIYSQFEKWPNRGLWWRIKIVFISVLLIIVDLFALYSSFNFVKTIFFPTEKIVIGGEYGKWKMPVEMSRGDSSDEGCTGREIEVNEIGVITYCDIKDTPTSTAGLINSYWEFVISNIGKHEVENAIMIFPPTGQVGMVHTSGWYSIDGRYGAKSFKDEIPVGDIAQSEVVNLNVWANRLPESSFADGIRLKYKNDVVKVRYSFQLYGALAATVRLMENTFHAINPF